MGDNHLRDMAGGDEEVTILGVPIVEKGASEKFAKNAPPIKEVTAVIGSKVSVRTSRRLLKVLACLGCVSTCVFVGLGMLHII